METNKKEILQLPKICQQGSESNFIFSGHHRTK